MTDILNRLRSAESGSKKLDVDIFWELFPGSKPNLHTALHIPDYTTSIDAALALVEKMRPGWKHWALVPSFIDDLMGGGLVVRRPMFTFELCHPDSYHIGDPELWPDNIIAECSTIPLAILTALFTALEAKESDHV